jgi:type II secretory pathway pseudopilin PulG
MDLRTTESHVRVGRGSTAGFSLLEVVFATAILIGGAGALAQLFLASTQANRLAQHTTFAALLAEQKMEQLLAGGSGLDPSPPDALDHDTPGYCEFLDLSGRLLASGAICGDGSAGAAPGAAFIRRWAVVPRSAAPTDAVVLQVLVASRAERQTVDNISSGPRAPGSVHLVAALARKAAE